MFLNNQITGITQALHGKAVTVLFINSFGNHLEPVVIIVSSTIHLLHIHNTNFQNFVVVSPVLQDQINRIDISINLNSTYHYYKLDRNFLNNTEATAKFLYLMHIDFRPSLQGKIFLNDTTNSATHLSHQFYLIMIDRSTTTVITFMVSVNRRKSSYFERCQLLVIIDTSILFRFSGILEHTDYYRGCLNIEASQFNHLVVGLY